tara:strand:+ start:445 stop:732 length:288 start_codon:yes stop_codon:yes gene_type:complete
MNITITVMTLSKILAYNPLTNPIPIASAENATTASTTPNPAGVKLRKTEIIDKTDISNIKINGISNENALKTKNNFNDLINQIPKSNNKILNKKS